MTSPANKKPSSTTPSAEPAPGVETNRPLVVSSELFVSNAEAPLSENEYLKRIEAILKLVGLPPLAEFNRMEAEAEVRANKRSTKLPG